MWVSSLRSIDIKLMGSWRQIGIRWSRSWPHLGRTHQLRLGRIYSYEQLTHFSTTSRPGYLTLGGTYGLYGLYRCSRRSEAGTARGAIQTSLSCQVMCGEGKKNKEQSLAGSYYYSAMGGWVQHCQGQHLTSLPSYDTLFFV